MRTLTCVIHTDFTMRFSGSVRNCQRDQLKSLDNRNAIFTIIE